MLWTLYRYILREMLRNLLLATAVLVTVMSVAAAVKPLSDGYLGPLALIRFIFFMAPAMLALALPFTGAFAATLVFHRLMADSEITLCRASGISYRRLVMPAIMLGIAAAVCLSLLSCWVIPWFYERAEHTLQKDIVTMVIRKVQNSEPIRYDRLVLYADAAAKGAPPAFIGPRGMTPHSLIALTGIAVGRIDDNGRIQSDGAADHADMLLYTDDDASWIIIKLRNVQYFGDTQRGMTEAMTIGPYRVNSPFRQKLRFFSLPQLLRLEAEPERYHSIKQAKVLLASQLAAENVKRTIIKHVNAVNTALTFSGTVHAETYAVHAAVAQRNGGSVTLTGTDDAPLTVERIKRDGQISRRFLAHQGAVNVEAGEDEPHITLQLTGVRVIDAAQVVGEGSSREVHMIKSLTLPEHFAAPLRALPLRELKAIARHNAADNTAVTKQLQITEDKYSHLMRMTSAEIHERAALVVCTLVMMVGGAILGMMMSGRLALVVYLWMFLLAAASVITTKTGGNLIATRPNGYATGLMVLWTGNAVAAAVFAILFQRLKRT